MKVKEIMTKEVVNIKHDDNSRNALDQLFKMRISGLPVVDKENKLVGMFTEKVVLAYILPSYIGKVGGFVYQENPKSIGKKFQDLRNVSISKIMLKEAITINEDATLCEVARLMLTRGVRRIPVLDKEKRLIGIVTREDVIRAYAKESGG